MYLDQSAVHDRVFLERSDFDDPALVQFVSEGAKPEAVTSASPSSSALLSHTTSSSSSAPITPSLGSSVQSVSRSPSSAPESPDSPRLNTSGLFAPRPTSPTSPPFPSDLFSFLLNNLARLRQLIFETALEQSFTTLPSFISNLSVFLPSTPADPISSAPVTPPPASLVTSTPSSLGAPLRFFIKLFASSPSSPAPPPPNTVFFTKSRQSSRPRSIECRYPKAKHQGSNARPPGFP